MPDNLYSNINIELLCILTIYRHIKQNQLCIPILSSNHRFIPWRWCLISYSAIAFLVTDLLLITWRRPVGKWQRSDSQCVQEVSADEKSSLLSWPPSP